MPAGVKQAVKLGKRLAGLLDDAPADAARIVGYHYGRDPNLTLLEGARYGTGARGREAERIKYATDPRLKQRVYFYGPQEGLPIPKAEPVVHGGHVYVSEPELGGLYVPGQSDPEIIKASRFMGQLDPDMFESNLLDAGYTGYFTPQSNQAVILGQDVPVRYLGTRYDLANPRK
jgi:hypothetical protein